jgi:hypothetical protein
MTAKQQAIAILVLVMSLTMSGCGPGQLFGPTFTPTHTPTPTSTFTPAWTPTPPPTSTLPPTSTPTRTPTLTPVPRVIDDFDDGVICNIWRTNSSDHARVYEANGVLNVDIGAGPTTDGGNQVAGVESKDFILHGDFDVQVDFQLSAGYHSIPEANTKLILLDQNGYGLEISVRTGLYLSKEVFPGGSGIEQNL